MRKKINMDFSQSSKRLAIERKKLFTPEQLEKEFHMPGFAKAYNEGTQTRFIPKTEEGVKAVITLSPYTLPVPAPLNKFIENEEKGFRLFIDVKEGDGEPYRHALFFEERVEGKLTHNGGLYARQEDGGTKMPKMIDATMKALFKRLLGYKPTPPSFTQNNILQP